MNSAIGVVLQLFCFRFDAVVSSRTEHFLHAVSLSKHVDRLQSSHQSLSVDGYDELLFELGKYYVYLGNSGNHAKGSELMAKLHVYNQSCYVCVACSCNPQS